MTGIYQSWLPLQQIFQRVALVVIILLSCVIIGATLAAAVGLAPWLSLTVGYGETAVPYAGMITQLFFTALAVSLCFYLPSSRRILDLEKSHRNFHISMEDVTRAYLAAHKADKEELFTLSSEFDSMRERIMHLRSHPDLHTLEPSVLEVAAQMSRESRDLASVYSEEKVDRARDFLRQRQREIEDYRESIALAQQTCADLKRWSQQVNVEESVASAQMQRLEADLAEILPLIGYQMADTPKPKNVVPLQKQKSSDVNTR